MTDSTNDYSARSPEDRSGAGIEPLSNSLSTLVQARLPLAPGLRAMASETTSWSVKRSLSRIADQLEQGVSLSEALSNVQSRFSPALSLFGSSGIGQVSGVDRVLLWIIELSRRTSELRWNLWASMIYPAFLFCLAGLISLLMVNFVGQCGVILNDFNTELPAITKYVFVIGRISSKYIVPLGLTFVTLFSVIGYAATVHGNWLVTRHWSGWIPILGPIFRRIAVAEFCHLLAVFLETGLPLCASIKAAGESMDDEWMKSLALTMARDIDRGIEPQSVVHALGLPSPISHALRESTSPESMVEILHGLGDIYAARTEVNSTLVATVVEPLVMASIVSLLVLLVIAIFMPLIKLLNDLS